MRTLLERFRELPDYRKCKQLKFNVGDVYVTFSDIIGSEWLHGYGVMDKIKKRGTNKTVRA